MAVSVNGLKKAYGSRAVLKGVSFQVPKGSIFALLGSNGAGKTTTVRILTTQISPDEGRVFIDGTDVVQDPETVHEKISLTGQFAAVDEALTGMENLRIMGKLYHIPDVDRRTSELLESFGLSEAAEQRVGAYSGGMKRKLDIAMSLMGNPGVLFLDEPTTGLDPQSRIRMWKMIRQLSSSGVTVFLTTQYLEEAEYLADLVGILDQGVMIAQGSTEELKNMFPQGKLDLTFSDRKQLERGKECLGRYKCHGTDRENVLTVYTDGREDTLTEILYCLCQNQIRIVGMNRKETCLEDVFLSLIGEKEEYE